MKKTLLLLFIFTGCYFNIHSQSLSITPISKETSCDQSINYLEFSGKASKKLISTLNKEFGYRMTLLKMLGIDRASSKIKDEELEKKFCDIMTEKEDDMLGSIEYEINYNENHLLSILETQVPEGLRKVSNSLVSDFPLTYSYIYNCQTGKEISELTDFLTEEGIIYITTTIKKTLDERVNRLAIETPKDYECPFSNNQNLSYYLNLKYNITNSLLNESENNLYFYFTEDGLIVDSNISPCWRPNMQITFPYQELRSFCIDNSSNPICIIAKKTSEIYTATSYTVKNTTSLTEEPVLYHTTPLTKPYLVKGDKVKVLGEIKNAVKINYVTYQGKELIGWIFKGDLE